MSISKVKIGHQAGKPLNQPVGAGAATPVLAARSDGGMEL